MGSRMLGHDTGSVARKNQDAGADAEAFRLPGIEELAAEDDGGSLNDSIEDRSFAKYRTIAPAEWKVRFQYRERVRQFAERWPQASQLLSYLEQDSSQRDARLRAAFTGFIVSDILASGEAHTEELGCSDLKIERSIQDALLNPMDHTQIRFIVVPDMSPVVVSLLGETFNINPLVFAAALQNLWKDPQFDSETLSLKSLDRSFGNALFSYDCGTEHRSSLMLFTEHVPANDFYEKLNSLEVTEIIDSAVMEQDCKDKFGSRALAAFHPILCPPLRKDLGGVATLTRSFQAMNRLTGYRVENTDFPICKPSIDQNESRANPGADLLLTTSSNDWCERDRHLFEAAQPSASLPSWVDRLTARISKHVKARIVHVRTQDNGNPFFSRFLGHGSSTSNWWEDVSSKPASEEDWDSLAAYYTRDLLPLLQSFQQEGRRRPITNDQPHSSEALFVIEVWATKRAIQAFEEMLSMSRARLTRFKGNVELYKSIPFSGRIKILRDHRSILESNKERIEAHIRKFEISSLRALAHPGWIRADYDTEVKALLLQLQESRVGMHAVLEANEQLIRDCLFDLQLELTNTQLDESRRSIAQNATVKRLTVLAFVFIPISTVAGIFGMNVEGLIDIQPWVVVVTVVSVMLVSSLVAGHRVVKALLSAVEALAYRHASIASLQLRPVGPDMTIGGPTKVEAIQARLVRAGWWLVSFQARLCVAIFAFCSLLFLPIEIGYYLLRQSVQYGIVQESVHAERRIRVQDSSSRNMVYLSAQSWLKQVRYQVWWRRMFWKLALIPALIYAYIAHHLDPQV